VEVVTGGSTGVTGGGSGSTPNPGSAGGSSNPPSNTFQGTEGADAVSATLSKDIFTLQGGNDVATSTFDNLKQGDSIDGGSGLDKLVVTGGSASDSLNL
jgi:hypothetical protein